MQHQNDTVLLMQKNSTTLSKQHSQVSIAVVEPADGGDVISWHRHHRLGGCGSGVRQIDAHNHVCSLK